MKHFLSMGFIALGTALLAQNNVLDDYTSESLRAEIQERPKVVLLDFESETSMTAKTLNTSVGRIGVEQDPGTARVGNGFLRVHARDVADGHHEGLPVFELELETPVDFSKYRALSFWFYVPPETTDFFYGRHDIRVQLNDSKQMRTWPAVVSGWHWYVFDFDRLEELPVVEQLRIRLGPFLEGFDEAALLFDQFELTPMDAPAPEASSWSARYSALNALVEEKGVGTLEAVLEACSDESLAVRSQAVRLASKLVPQNPAGAVHPLRAVLGHPEWRTRLAALEIIARLHDVRGLDAETIYRESLFDDVFYIRDFADKQLRDRGMTTPDIAGILVGSAKVNPGQEIPALRRLAEIGPGVHSALPYLLTVVRDPAKSHRTRCWALRAIWEIDETPLIPADWALALALNPGEVHYHLLNRAMDRLEQASTTAVPVLITMLSSTNPEVRARACVVLGRIGPDAAGASRPLRSLLSDDWPVAWEADQALAQILPGHQQEVTGPPPLATAAEDIRVEETETTTTLSNGLVELVFRNGDESPGPFMVRKPGGINLFDADWLDTILAFKHSKAPNMIERQWLQRLFGSPFSRDVSTGIARATPDLVDYKILFRGNDVAPIEFEYHYVLKRGESGFHTYMITRNISGEDLIDESFAGQIGVGRFNFLVALTQGAFEYLFLHDKLKGPAAFTNVRNEPMIEGYPDIYQSTFRLPSGDIGAKHEWENYELFSPVNGYTSEENGGVWLITPSHEFMDDSMPRFIKRPVYGFLFIPHLQGKYHIKTGARAPADWEKIYGPMYFYLNDGENPEAMWVDAKREAAAQVAQWPYSWMEASAYHHRGALEGSLQITDGTSPEGAYVVLSNPAPPGDPDQYGVWMRNIGPYHYWTEADANGSFKIPDVHAGSYQLFAFKPGLYGEVGPLRVDIAAGQNTAAGRLRIEPIRHGRLLWRIGIPDGMAMEFKNGRNYHQWDNYLRYRKDFPQDVHYIVGESDWSQDWNYLQPAIVQGEDTPTTWTISFEMEAPPEAEALLSIMCSGRGAKARVLLNKTVLGELTVDIGNQHARTAPVGETVCRKYTLSPDLFRPGTNQLEISFASDNERSETQFFQNWTHWLCYDFLQLEILEPEPR